MNCTKLPWKIRKLGYLMLISGVVFLSGSCQTDFWTGKSSDKSKEKEKKEVKKEKTQAEKDAERFAFLKTQRKEYVPGEKPETISQELVKEELPDNKGKVSDKVDKIRPVALTPPQPKLKERMHFYDDFIILNGNEEVEVSLVFNNAPLLDVLPSFADALGFNFLADSDLKGVVTLNIDQKMTRKDLWNTFDKMLSLAGAGVVVDGTILRIMSLNKIGRAADSRLSKDGSGELLYFPLKNTLAKEAMQQVRQFLSPNAVVVELTRPNAVMIADDRANMPKVKQVLEHLDMAGKAGWFRKVIPCNNILPSKLTEELTTILPVLGFNVYKKTDRTEQPGSVQVTGVDRLQMVVISAATEEAIKEIAQWVDLLDNADHLDQERIFVYKVRNNKAINLAHALAMIYDMQGSSMTIDTNTGNTRTENINTPASRNTRTTANRNNTNRNQNNATTNSENTQTDLKSSVFNTPVRVFADGVLNRLVVRTTPRTYASIKALLSKLDIVPAQVLLQVLVVEVTLTESTKFGLEFSAMASNGTDSNTLIGTNYANLIKPVNAEAGTVSGSGLSGLFEDPKNPNSRFGYLQALAGNGTVKVLSSPQLLVSSHTEAQINVGTKISIKTGSVTTSQSNGGATNTFTYQNTGVTLTVTPQVTSTNLISLKIKQELSIVDQTQKSGNTTTTTTSNGTVVSTVSQENPDIDQRLIETAMTIANGRTMIIGGLIQENVKDNLKSIPWINQIPILNRLTGSTEYEVERTELLVMITGYIINEQSQLESMINRYNEALKSLNQFDKDKGPDRDKRRGPLLNRKEFWTDGTFLEK